MKNIKKIIILILFLILVALILLLKDIDTNKEYTKNYFYMDTYINIKINSNLNKKKIDKIFEDIDYLYSTYHKLTDRYNEYDGIINVYYLNELLEDNKEIKIDKRLSTIINLGIDYYDKTDGYFNIAAGNLTSKWKEFLEECQTVPEYSELNNLNINIKDINLDNDIYIKKNNIKLDLGGISKGYTTELVGKYLEDNHIYSYIINAGGNVKAGKKAPDKKFIIGITSPENTKDIFTKVNINNKAVVTSGDYQRYCIQSDKRYNHIINPFTKFPSDYYRSATIISSSSTLADIYSTYLFQIPLEEGKKIINSIEDIEAIWYIDKDNIIKSDGFNYE